MTIVKKIICRKNGAFHLIDANGNLVRKVPDSWISRNDWMDINKWVSDKVEWEESIVDGETVYTRKVTQ